MSEKRDKVFERYTIEQVLSMSINELDEKIFMNDPVVLISKCIQILAIFEKEEEGIFIEVSHIYSESGFLLMSMWNLIEGYAKEKNCKYIKWIFYTINNLVDSNFKKELIKKGFEVNNIEGIGQAYYYKYYI
jgi:hypothetical protein